MHVLTPNVLTTVGTFWNRHSRGLQLFVGNLAYKTTTESLQAEFSSVGELLTCDVIVRLAGQRTRSLGYGFISYKTQEEADAAVAKYNHQVRAPFESVDCLSGPPNGEW